MSAVLQASQFDWRNPDYTEVYRTRAERLQRIRAQPSMIPALKAYYAENVADFIEHWGLTVDPRNALLVPPREVSMPFVLFPKQREWIDWLLERARAREPGLTEKSRDCGISWLAMCTAATLCLFRQNIVIGVGSAKEDKVDRSGDPDCLLWKAREFLKHLPPEFRDGWDEDANSAHMRITFPTGSAIVGEAGENIGRGGRSSIYFIDESAFLSSPRTVDAALSANTSCRQDISTPNGRANPFAEKRHSGRIKVFSFTWRDDPRKDEAWYAKQCEELDPVTVAQEIDINYSASVEGVLIPSAWVSAAIDAHRKLGITPTGMRRGALDVADSGVDRNAFAGRHGILLEFLQSWSGKNSDIYRTVQRTFAICDERGYDRFDYDADGLGAGVRGDAREINEKRRSRGLKAIVEHPFRGSGAVDDPDGQMVKGRKNKDFFANYKAQSWWSLRLRFQNTHRAVVDKLPFNPNDIISIDPALPELNTLALELAQPTFSINNAGKIIVNKQPDGTQSPNVADAAMIAFQPAHRAMDIWIKLAE